MLGNSLKFVPYKDRKAVAGDLKRVCLSPSEIAASDELEAFSGKWDKKYPLISRSWRNRRASLFHF
jgi:transposase-like protein